MPTITLNLLNVAITSVAIYAIKRTMSFIEHVLINYINSSIETQDKLTSQDISTSNIIRTTCFETRGPDSCRFPINDSHDCSPFNVFQ